VKCRALITLGMLLAFIVSAVFASVKAGSDIGNNWLLAAALEGIAAVICVLGCVANFWQQARFNDGIRS